MTPIERRAVTSLAGVFSLRLFGLFLILPVFALYAEQLEHNTPALIGLTLGAYGLTQAILQIPFGLLSDRWGRKNTIIFGLVIFIIGSVIAAMSDSIYGVLLGRLVQGAGAISSAIVALLADLTREDQRTKSMAVIGVGIGVVFMLSMMLGPLLDNLIGVSGIFWLTALFSILAIGVVKYYTPEPETTYLHREAQPVVGQIGSVIRDGQLLRLDFGIFSLHLVLTAMFVVVPSLLLEQGELAKTAHWQVYVPVMLLGVVGMLPFMAMSHQRDKVTLLFRLAIAILVLGEATMYFMVGTSWWGLLAGLTIFFVGFNTLEATLPSLISRVAPAASKGTAMGVYNSAQFFGVFVGGASAGWVAGLYGAKFVFLFCLAVVTLWLLWAMLSPAFRLGESRLLHVGECDADQVRLVKNALLDVAGVEDVTLWQGEPTAYLRIDRDNLDENALEAVKLSVT